jgi:putative flippase GtrA
MHTFSKAQLASLFATAVDFGATAWAGGWLQGGYVAATMLGTVCGGVVHFWLGRNWVFGARAGKTGPQAARYLVIWVGNLLLNGAGVFTATHFLAVNPLVAKAIVAVLVGCSYNYLVQSHFVYK